MTQQQAEQWVREHTDDDALDDDELEDAFAAFYQRSPDAQDRQDGLWSLCIAAVEND